MPIDFQPDDAGPSAIAFEPDPAPAGGGNRPLDFQPDPSPSAPDLPTLSATPAEGLIHKALREARESLSPLIGPTEGQALREGVNGVYKPLGDRIEREGFLPAVTSPTLPNPVEGLTPDEIKNMPTSLKIAAGLSQGAENLGAGIVFTGGAAMDAAPALAKRVIAGYFASKMAAAAGTQAGNLSVNPDARTIAQAALELPASAVFAYTGAREATARGAVGEVKAAAGVKPTATEAAPARVPASEFAEPVQFTPDPEPAFVGEVKPAADLELSPAAVPSVASVPSTQSDIAGAPVQRVPAESITTRPDLMQFKRMDDTDTGVNKNDELSGKWDDLKAGNLLLWEPNDPAAYGLGEGEKYIVANGHHRYEFGERQDVPAYNAQVVKESEGYSAQDARSLAAEINIADGKGTIYDQVKFLRNESATHGPDAALARAGSIGVKGQSAAAIAFEASPDTYDSFVNERISPEQSEAIARAAPASTDPAAAPLQRMGIKAALDGSSPQAIRNLVQAVRVESASVPMDQLDLFGADDSAMTTATQLSKVAGRIQNALSAEIKSTDSAAKNASTAKAKGISFDVPPEQILAANAALKGERQRWDNWALHPDLVSQVREYSRMEQSGQGGAPAAKPSLEDRLQSLKIKPGGKVMSSLIPGVDPETFRAVWNTSLDVATAAVRAGKAIGEAIQAAVDHLRLQFPQGDEATLRGAMATAMGYDQRAFGQTVRADRDLSPDVQSGVNEYYYRPRSNETDAQSAQRIIQERGFDNAIAAYKDGDNWHENGAVRSALGKQLIKSLADAERQARASGNTIESRQLVGKQVDLIDHDLRRSTDIAQALQAMSMYSRMSAAGLIAHAQRAIEGAGDAAVTRLKPALDRVKDILRQSNDQALDDFKHDPEVNAAVKNAVDATVANHPDVHKAVIMDLTPGQSLSPTIVAHARALVASRANDLLKAEPAVPGVPATKRLKVILDDLAARAAGIAAGHFQGAEPGTTLKDKLKQRLGLSEEKGKQLAAALEKKFSEQVAAAKSKLPASIARARAKAEQPYNPLDTSDTAVDKEIRRQLVATKLKLTQVLHTTAAQQDATGKGIAERVVAGTGLEGDPVQLRATFQRRWDALVNARKRTALQRLLANGERGNGTVKKIWQRVVDLSNLGAFSDKQYYDAVREKLGLPAWTADVAAEITRRANDLQAKPEGFQRDNATTDLLNYIAKTKGVKLSDMAMGVWYANVLSGVTTPVHVLVDNLGSLAGNFATGMLRDPGALLTAVGAIGRGFGKGALDAASVLRTGKVNVTGVPKPSGALELDPFGGPLKFVNLLKYVGRGLSAAHVATFKPAWELKSALMAREVAKSEGLNGPARTQRVADLLANTDGQVLAAKAQATAEGLTGLEGRRRVAEILEQQRNVQTPGMTDQARDYALRATYLNKPYGMLGLAGEAYNNFVARVAAQNPKLALVPKLIVPFTRVVSNLVNEKLNYTPVGAWRAWQGGKTGELYGQALADDRLQPAQRDLYAKSIMGTLAVSALATAAAQYLHDPDPKFAITGSGPATPEGRKQLMESGWRPNSLKIGSRYIAYNRLPGGFGLAVIGNYLDAIRYKNLDQQDALNRAAYALQIGADTIVHQSYLQSLGQVLEAVGNDNPSQGAGKLQKMVAQTASSFVVPNALRQLDRVFDPRVYAPSDIEGMVRSQVPFLRREGNPTLNVLGEPIERSIFGYDISKQSQDPVWRTLAAKQAWVPATRDTIIIGDKKQGPGAWRALTPSEMYQYQRTTGQAIRAQVEKNLPAIQAMPNLQAQAFVRKLAEAEHAKAKAQYR